MNRRPCRGLFNTIVIDVDGNITTCCLDEKMRNKIGNLDEIDLYYAWHCPKIESWRQAQINGKFEDSGPFCTKCNFKTADTMSDFDIQDYLEKRYQRKARLLNK